MTSPAAFLSHGLAEARRALDGVAAMTRAHLSPVTLARTLAQRVRAELARLEIIIRRLLVLMALGLVLPSVRIRAVSVHAPAPDGVETKAARGLHGFAPRCMGSAWDGDGFETGSARVCGPVPAARLLARLAALQQVLAAPDVHARRLARTLERQRKGGEARPVALPMIRTHRMPPELGAVATALPGLLRQAFETWETSG